MNYMQLVLHIFILLHLTVGWQMPSAKFLLDLENIYNWKSVVIYLPNNSENWISELK